MRTLRILCVEDNRPYATAFVRSVTLAFGALAPDVALAIEHAASKNEAIAKAGPELDAAIVDLKLGDDPDGGFDVVERLMEVAPLAFVIVVSGNVDSRASLRAQDLGAEIVPKDTELDIGQLVALILKGTRSPYERTARLLAETREPLPDKLDEAEAAIVQYALAKCEGNKSAAARELGVARQSIQARTRDARPPARARSEPR